MMIRPLIVSIFCLIDVVLGDFIRIFPEGSTFIIQPINSTYIGIKAEVALGTYLAIGFSPTMADSDMIVFQAHTSMTPEVADYYSSAYRAPDLDGQQDLENIVVTTNDTFAFFEMERKLDTGDTS